MALTAPSSTLTGQTIAASYDQVLFLDAAAGVTEATLKIVSGTAGKTALSISDEHVLIKGVDTNNAAGFEVQQTDGTSILKVAAGTPAATLVGDLTVTGNSTFTTADNTDTLSLISTDADANSGPNLRLYRNSSSPADSDLFGQIDFEGRNDNSQDFIATQIKVNSGDVSDGTEDAQIEFDVMTAGTLREYLRMAAGSQPSVIFNQDSRDIDFRVLSDNLDPAFLVQGSDGNVGIGTDAPTFFFTAIGTATGDQATINQTHASYTGSALKIGAVRAANSAYNLLYCATGTGAGGTSGTAQFVVRGDGNVGIGDTDPSEAKLSIAGVASGDYALNIDNDRNTSAIYIDQDGATNSHCIYVNTPTTTTGRVLLVSDCNSLTTGSAAMFTTASTTLETSASGGLVVISSDADTDVNVNNVLYLLNDHADSSGTTCLFINQDANQRGITIDSEATSAPNLIFLAPAMQTGQIIEVNDANSLTTGGCAYFFSNSPDNTSSRNLVTIVNENAAADKAVGLLIQQDGADASIEFTGAGGGGIKFSMGTDPDTAGTATGNTLDDYEEGTFLVDFTAGSGTITRNASFDTGLYTKIGRMVTVTGGFAVSAISSPSGELTITGLPFTNSNESEYSSLSGATVYFRDAATDIANYVTGFVNSGTTHIVLREGGTTGSGGDLAAHVDTDTLIYISATYFV